MARPLLGLLLILPLAAAVSDPEGDTTESFGGPAVVAPAVDLRNVTAELAGGELTLRLETWGPLLIGDQANEQDGDRLYTYLFIVAIGAEPDDNVYTHIAEGKEGLTTVCTYHQGFLDLACEVTQGEAALRGTGASGHNLTARFAVDFDGQFAVAGSSQMSIPNGTSRRILAQDFTDNALPYQGLPDGGEVVTPEPPEATPWWRSPWTYGVAAVIIGVILVPFEWFTPGYWQNRKK